MAKSRRKPSPPTISATGDPGFQKESKVLKGLTDANADDWPCFVLRNAVIYHKGGKQFADPLLCLPDERPILVRGRLRVDDMEPEERKLLINPNIKFVDIEITSSKLYSIEQKEFGARIQSVIWVSGDSGWFQIRASPEYSEIFNGAKEATELYYILANHAVAVQEARRDRKRLPERLTLNAIFFKCAEQCANGLYFEEAQDICHKYASFLIEQLLLENVEGLTSGDFFRWIVHQHPEIYVKALKRDAARRNETLPDAKLPAKPTTWFTAPYVPNRSARVSPATTTLKAEPKPAESGSRSVRQSVEQAADVDMRDVSAMPPASSLTLRPGVKRRTTESLPSGVTTPSKMTPIPTPTTEFIADMLRKILEDYVATSEIPADKMTISKVKSHLYYTYTMKKYDGALEILAYYSNDLLPRLNEEWYGSEFYKWLEEKAKQPEKELVYTTVEAIPAQLRKRQKVEKTPRAQPSRISASLLSHRNTPTMAHSTTSRGANSHSDSDDDDDDEASGRHRAMKGGLRITSAKKRKASDMDMDIETGESSTGRPSRKAAKTQYTQFFPPQIPPVGDQSDEGDIASDDDDEKEDPYAGQYPPDSVRLVIHAEKLPTMSPSGPNGTWVCDDEDCPYVVRAADEELGQVRICAHIAKHQEVQLAALAESEARGGGHPFNHLLSKIQSRGKQSLEEQEQKRTRDGPGLPHAIKRGLLF